MATPPLKVDAIRKEPIEQGIPKAQGVIGRPRRPEISLSMAMAATLGTLGSFIGPIGGAIGAVVGVAAAQVMSYEADSSRRSDKEKAETVAVHCER